MAASVLLKVVTRLECNAQCGNTPRVMHVAASVQLKVRVCI